MSMVFSLCNHHIISYIKIYPIFPTLFEMTTPGETTGGNLPKRSFNCSKILLEPRKTMDQLSELRKHWKHKSTWKRWKQYLDVPGS